VSGGLGWGPLGNHICIARGLYDNIWREGDPMGIVVTCKCGKKLTAPDDAGGRHGRCSECGRTVFIPRSTDRALIIWTGTDMFLMEEAIKQTVGRLPEVTREAMLDEADKWAKAWRLPPERQPREAGEELICDMVVSCVQRDAAVGMDRMSVLMAKGEQMLRILVARQGEQLLHFVARIGPDQYITWHHRDAEDDEIDDAKQKTGVMQSLASGVVCDKCGYNMGYCDMLSKPGLAPIVGYYCSQCQHMLCTKCQGKIEQGCTECGAGRDKLQYLARRRR